MYNKTRYIIYVHVYTWSTGSSFLEGTGVYHVFSKICAWNRFDHSIHLANVAGNAHANTA